MSCQSPFGTPDGVASIDGMMEPEFLANVVVESIGKEEFLILPHPEVKTYFERKASDYDRWIRGMRRLHEKNAKVREKR